MHSACRSAVQYLDNFRSLMLARLQLSGQLKRRAQLHTRVHLWKAPPCFTRTCPRHAQLSGYEHENVGTNLLRARSGADGEEPREQVDSPASCRHPAA